MWPDNCLFACLSEVNKMIYKLMNAMILSCLQHSVGFVKYTHTHTHYILGSSAALWPWVQQLWSHQIVFRSTETIIFLFSFTLSSRLNAVASLEVLRLLDSTGHVLAAAPPSSASSRSHIPKKEGSFSSCNSFIMKDKPSLCPTSLPTPHSVGLYS